MRLRKLFILLAMGAVLSVASCQPEVLIEPVDGGLGEMMPLSISASGESDDESPESKVYLDFSQGASNILWEQADSIAVFDGSGKRDFNCQTVSGSSASFSGQVIQGYTSLCAVYPYLAGISRDGTNVSVSVPAVQTVNRVGSGDPAALVSVGYRSGNVGNITFHPITGLVSFVVASDDIFKVIIEGTNLAGTATVNASTGVVSSVTAGYDKVEVGYIGGGNFPRGTFYAALLPGTTAKDGFAVSFVHVDGITHRKAVQSAVTINRKGRLAAGTVVRTNPKIRHIYNKAQLDAWGAAMGDNGGDEQSFTVYLDADINYGSDIWPYTAKDTHFNGNFKGQNHKIYNMKIESGTNTSFITGLYGRLNDVIFGSSDGVNWDGTSYIKHTGNTGSKDIVEYVGFVGELRATDVTFMTNVINYAPVYVPSGYNTRAFLGGLVGHIQSDKTVTMTNCKNYGSVSNSSSWAGAETRMGGILGQCDGALLATGLENHGGLTVNNAETTFVGGLCGDLGSGSKVSNCKNYGSITFSDSGSILTYLGGCFGSVRGDPKTTIEDCHNYSAITASRNVENRFGGIVGNLQSGEVIIMDCGNHGNLEVASSVAKRSFLGGIVGTCRTGSQAASILDCTNDASVTNRGGASEIGGIAGNLYFDSSNTIVVSNCSNTGAVSSKVLDGACSSVGNVLSVGGICGSLDSGGESTAILVEYCTNNGQVTASGALKNDDKLHMHVGGIAGTAFYKTTIDNCQNLSQVNCDHAGNSNIVKAYVGGILAWVDGYRSSSRYQTVSNCINTGTVSSIRTAGGEQQIGGIIGSGHNQLQYGTKTIDNSPIVSGCKNYGNVSLSTSSNSGIGGLCGYTCWKISNCSTFGNVSGGQYHGAIYGDNNNASSCSGCKVGSNVIVNNVVAPAIGNYSFNSGADTAHSNPDKGWFTGWNGNAALTVTVVSQESYSGGSSPAGGYLFAHTGNGDGKYYRMYYAISHDGLSWTVLNSGASPMPTYYGFPYITKDNSGVYYLIGVTNSDPRNPVVWRSTDCVTWTVAKSIPASVFNLPSGYENDTNSYGAIKIFHDPVSKQFVLTWHAGESGKSGDAYWESMRTFYVCTSDFETFTTAQKLFSFNTGHIDTSLHYYDGKYYALYKHELTYKSDKSYYKRPRMCSSTSLTGSYSLVTSNNYLTHEHREGPTMVKSPDNSKWYLYVENYDDGAHVYELYYSTSLTVSGPWTQNNSFTPPANANGCRHGCVIPIDAKTYRRLRAVYGN